MYIFGRNGSVLICSLRGPLSLLTVAPLPYINLSFVFIMNLYLPPVGMCLWKLPRPERFAPPTDGQMKKTDSSYLLYLEKNGLTPMLDLYKTLIGDSEPFWKSINKYLSLTMNQLHPPPWCYNRILQLATCTLHYITYLHYITLHYITLHYITSHHIALHCIALHYITLHTYITYIT